MDFRSVIPTMPTMPTRARSREPGGILDHECMTFAARRLPARQLCSKQQQDIFLCATLARLAFSRPNGLTGQRLVALCMLVCCCVFAGLTPRATLSLLNREQKSLISILRPAFRREPSYDGCNGAGTEARERGEKTAGAKADCRQIVRVVARRPQQWRDAHFNTVQLCEPPVSGGG